MYCYSYTILTIHGYFLTKHVWVCAAKVESEMHFAQGIYSLRKQKESRLVSIKKDSGPRGYIITRYEKDELSSKLVIIHCIFI